MIFFFSFDFLIILIIAFIVLCIGGTLGCVLMTWLVSIL